MGGAGAPTNTSGQQSNQQVGQNPGSGTGHNHHHQHGHDHHRHHHDHDHNKGPGGQPNNPQPANPGGQPVIPAGQPKPPNPGGQPTNPNPSTSGGTMSGSGPGAPPSTATGGGTGGSTNTTSTASAAQQQAALVRRPLASCYVDGASTVFIVDVTQGHMIKYFRCPPALEDEKAVNRPDYQSETLVTDTEKDGIVATSSDIAAISYKFSSGVTKTVIFYADANQKLAGLYKESKKNEKAQGPWIRYNDIENLDVKVAKHSSVTVIMNEDGSMVKVYYWDVRDPVQVKTPRLAWLSAANGKWQVTKNAIS